MLSLRAHAWIFVIIFAVIVVLSMIGNALDGAHAILRNRAIQRASIDVFMALLLALWFSAVPLMVKLVLAANIRAGNAGRPALAWLMAHQRAVVFVLWGLLAAGLFVGVSVAFRGLLDFD